MFLALEWDVMLMTDCTIHAMSLRMAAIENLHLPGYPMTAAMLRNTL